jgi:hypothetical protein
VISTTKKLFYLEGTVGDLDTSGYSGTQWLPVSVQLPTEAGTLVSVSSGKHVVAITNDAERMWLGTGVGLDNPEVCRGCRWMGC